MISGSRLLAATLGRISPRYRTLGDWSETYKQIIAAKPVSEKTKANRRVSLGHILKGIGLDRTISGIKPHEIAGMVMQVAATRPQCAKRILIEAKDMFSEAVNYGWIDRNPATPIKAPHVRVQRQRLTLEQWRQIYAYSQAQQPPWVSRMLVLALVTGQRRSDVCKMRFDDIWDGHLHIEQLKTGERLALPVGLRLNVLGVSIEEAVESCRAYAVGSDYLLRKHNGKQLVLASLSSRFEEAREQALPVFKTGLPPSLHECRSLAERLYRAQGINTMILLGHKHQSMTDLYNDDRGLSRGEWRCLTL